MGLPANQVGVGRDVYPAKGTWHETWKRNCWETDAG
jgi:hypothetical protein